MTGPQDPVPEARSGAAVRFQRSLAWQSRGLPPQLLRTVRRYATLPVTLYCSLKDVASKEAELRLRQLLGDSPNVEFRVRYFGEEGCGMSDLLGDRVSLTVMRCQLDGRASDLLARPLVEALQEFALRRTGMLGRLYIPAAKQLAFASFGWGPKDPYAVMNKRAENQFCAHLLAVHQSCEDLGAQPLCSADLFDEDLGDVRPSVRRWAEAVASKVDDWALGRFAPEPVRPGGYEWSMDEIMLEQHLKDRKGMQDG